jgi:hypothetical protein
MLTDKRSSRSSSSLACWAIGQIFLAARDLGHRDLSFSSRAIFFFDPLFLCCLAFAVLRSLYSALLRAEVQRSV